MNGISEAAFEPAVKVVPGLQGVCRQRFVNAPVEWVRQAHVTGGRFAVVCALFVWFRHCVTRSDSFPVSNAAAAQFGMNRKQKAAGLRALARGGLILVSQSTGSSPVVQIVWKVAA